MPRNGTGTYGLPTGINPVADGTIISADWANTTLTDMSVAVSGSMPRDGQAPMTGPLKLADGSVGAPSVSWNSDSSTGFYRPGTGSIGITVGGIEQARFTSGNLLLGTTTNSGAKLNVVGASSLAGAVTITGPTVTTDVLTINSMLDTQIQFGASPLGTIEVGKSGRAVAGTPAIDFHSSTNDNDFDSRIIASGGAATAGKGMLALQAAQIHQQGGSSLTYYNSGAVNALDYNNGNHQRWTPGTGAQALTVANWPVAGRLGMLLVDAVNLGAATVTWPAGTRFIKSDGSETTNFSTLGITLQSSGTDRVFLWTFDGGATVYVRVMR